MLNELKVYDKALVNFFSVPKVEHPEAGLIPLVWSPPQRAFSTMAASLGLPPDTKRPPLPMMALHRMDFLGDWTRFNYYERAVVRYDSAPAYNLVKTCRPPQTVTIPYTLETWTLTTQEMNWVLHHLLLKFTQEIAYIQVNLEEYGCRTLSIRLEGYSNTTNLEPGEEERDLRISFNASLNGYIFRPLDQVKTVLEVDMVYRNWEDTETLETSVQTDP